MRVSGRKLQRIAIIFYLQVWFCGESSEYYAVHPQTDKQWKVWCVRRTRRAQCQSPAISSTFEPTI